MRMVLFGITGFLVVMLVVFAMLQWNDPDPYIWMPTYLLFALLGGFIWIRPLPNFWYIAAIILAIVFAILQRPAVWEGFGESMLNENMEKARESVGLLICAASAGYFWFASRKLRKQKL